MFKLFILFFPFFVFAVQPITETQDLEFVSLIKNSGFENGRSYWDGTDVSITAFTNTNIDRQFGSKYLSVNFNTFTSEFTQNISALGVVYTGRKCELSVHAKSITHDGLNFLTVWDNTNAVIVQKAIPMVNDFDKYTVKFDCPSAAFKIGFSYNSNLTNQLRFDNFYLGLAKDPLQYEKFIYRGYIKPAAASRITQLINTASNVWQSVSNSGLELVNVIGSAEIPCVGASPDGVTCSSSNEQFGIVVDIPRANKYKICTDISMRTDNGLEEHALKLSETELNSDTIVIDGNGRLYFEAAESSQGNYVISPCEFFEFTTAGKKNIKLFAFRDNTTTSEITVSSDGSPDIRNMWTIEEIDSVAIQNPIDEGLYFKRKMNGGNANFNTGSVPSLAGWSTESFEGNAKMPCGANASTLSGTCPAGNGELGIVFTVPQGKTGIYEVCYTGMTAGSGTGYHRWAKYANNSTTKIEDGLKVIGSTGGEGKPTTFCDEFNLSVGEHTFKVFTVSGTAHTIFGDEGSLGRNIVVYAKLRSKSVKSLITTDAITNGNSGLNEVIKSCYVSNPAGTPGPLNSLCDSWVDTITDNGVGDYTLNFVAGSFNASPVCNCTAKNDGTNNRGCSFTSITSTALRITIENYSAANVDQDAMITCHGVK